MESSSALLRGSSHAGLGDSGKHCTPSASKLESENLVLWYMHWESFWSKASRHHWYLTIHWDKVATFALRISSPIELGRLG